MFSIVKLTPSVFSDSIVDDCWWRTGSKNVPYKFSANEHKNNWSSLSIFKNWNILLFKEAIKIKEKKPILNTGFKTSKKLQLFWTDRVNNLWINLCKVPIVVQPISIQICTCCTSNFYALWRWFWWKSK